MIEMNKFFIELSKYASENWKGCFSEEEILEYADVYFCDFNYSNIHGEPTETIRTLCENLQEDIDNGIEQAEVLLDTILCMSKWNMAIFECTDCGKKQIEFFSTRELENLTKHANREMLIQDAIPDKDAWIRECFIQGSVFGMCGECWNKYFNPFYEEESESENV